MKYTVTNVPVRCFATVEVDIPIDKCGDIELQEALQAAVSALGQKKLTAGLDTSDVELDTATLDGGWELQTK